MTTDIECIDSSEEFYFQLAGIDRQSPLWNGHAITQDDAPAIQAAVESRIQALFALQDPNSSEFLRATVYFAYKGNQGPDQNFVERDIIELLNTPEGLLARGKDGVILPVGKSNSTPGFWQKHRTKILIGVTVVAIVATIVVISVATGGTGAAPAIAAGNSAGAALGVAIANSNNDSTCRPTPSNRSSSDLLPLSKPPSVATPSFSPPKGVPEQYLFQQESWRYPPQSPINQLAPPPLPPSANPFFPKDPLKFFPEPQNPFAQIPLPPPENIPSFVVDCEHGIRLLNPPPKEATFGDHARKFGSKITHDVFDEAASIASCVPQSIDAIKDIGNRFLPESLLSPVDPTLSGNTTENFNQTVTDGHQAIDRIFGTNQANAYLPGVPKLSDKFTYGVLPPPGQLPKNASSALKNMTNKPIICESTILYKKAQDLLKPFAKKPMPEQIVRGYIHQAGIPTFPRPKGIPEDFLVMISERSWNGLCS